MDSAEKTPGTIENGVLIGREGYLFLAEGAHGVSEYVTGKRSVAPRNFEVFRRNITKRVAWAVEHQAKYLHLIMPDKQSVIPDVWTLEPPVRLGQLYLDRLEDLQRLLLYPADYLAREGRAVTTKTDTHLSAYGSLLVASALAEGFTGVPQAEMLAKLAAGLTAETPLANDLGYKLTPPARETVKTLCEKPPGKWLSNRIPGGNNGGVDLRFNPRAPYQKCVVFFGDSFGRDVASMLQFWFSEVYFFRSGYFHPEIAALCEPDILITENVERYLDDCLDDNERPNFLLFPHLNEKSYEPDKVFAAALSAVLNYPRAPYVRYVTELGLVPRSARARQAVAPEREGLRAYEALVLRDAPEAQGVLRILEPQREMVMPPAEFVADFSGRGLALKTEEPLHIHGSYLVRREAVLLFGANHLVDRDGCWSCEARAHKGQFIEFYQAAFFGHVYPGQRLGLSRTAHGWRLETKSGTARAVHIDEPVFLATPLEPAIWGRWIATVAGKVAQYRQHGAGRKFLCHTAHDWQRAFLHLLGVADDEIMPHDPGQLYICRDVMTVEYSVSNMSISAGERARFYEIVARHRTYGAYPAKLFVSRLTRSRAAPHYRVLRNEEELAAALRARGFSVIEPELYSFAEQIGMFAAAEQIVFLGGSAVYNAVFCAPGTNVVTIESTDIYAGVHAALFATLGLRYGVVFGAEDMSDPQAEHRRWSLDVGRAVPVIEAFFAAG